MVYPEAEKFNAQDNFSSAEAEIASKPTSRAAVGEPFPEWSSAIETWGLAWHFYQFGLGAGFGVLALSTSFSLLRILKLGKSRRTKKTSSMFLGLLLLFGLTRCLFMCADAHHTRKVLPQAFLNILWSVGNPCILTAYTLIFMVLRNVFHLRERFQGWYTLRNILILTVPYFLLSFLAELVVVFVPNFVGVTFMCQLFYVLISLMLCSFYSYVGFLLWKNYKGANVRTRTGNRRQSSCIVADTGRGRRTLPMLKTCIAAAMGGITLCSLQIYSMTSVYGVFSRAVYVAPWPWLVYNYAMRGLELFLSFALLVTSRRSNNNIQIRGDPSFSISVKWSKKVRTVATVHRAT